MLNEVGGIKPMAQHRVVKVGVANQDPRGRIAQAGVPGRTVQVPLSPLQFDPVRTRPGRVLHTLGMSEDGAVGEAQAIEPIAVRRFISGLAKCKTRGKQQTKT